LKRTRPVSTAVRVGFVEDTLKYSGQPLRCDWEHLGFLVPRLPQSDCESLR
jgi:hypothetical protein